MRRPIVGILPVLILSASSLAANTFTVTTTSDSGVGSLRWAIEQANANPGADLVVMGLGPSLLTFRPLSPLPRVESDTTLQGGLTARVLDGSALSDSGMAGLRLGDRVTLFGLTVHGFHDSQGGAAGIRMEGTGSHLYRVYVGTDLSGTTAVGNDIGIEVTGADNIIGYEFEDTREPVVVSGNGIGIRISGTGTLVQQARIGLGATGGPLPNTGPGILINGGRQTQLGPADNPPLRLLVAGNGGSGLAITGSTASGNGLGAATLIYGNTGPAVDLGDDGATPNDPGDGDEGANGLQNFPVITSAVWNGDVVVVDVTLSGLPGRTYQIDLYAAEALDANGRGQARRFLRRVAALTDGTGLATLTFAAYGADADARFVSATATDPAGSVSELSPGVEPGGAAPAAAAMVVNTTDNAVDPGWCSPAHCSLQEATIAANLTPNGTRPTEVHFAIPGPGPHSTSLGFIPVAFSEPVVIDGYTQPGASPNTRPVGQGIDAVLRVTVTCTGLNTQGLFVTDDSVIRGLAFDHCMNATAIVLLGSRNVVEGCSVGTDAAGNSDTFNFQGIQVFGEDNRIGGTVPEARNLLAGNTQSVTVQGSAARTVIQGNLIGTTADGHSPARLGVTEYSTYGVFINGAATGTLVGGTAPGAGNLISGHVDHGLGRGVNIVAGASTRVEGNFIGTDVEGDAALVNDSGVVILRPEGTGNVVGGSAPGAGNVISGQTRQAVSLGLDAVGNRVEGNTIGLSADGTAVLGNGEGVFIAGSDNVVRANTIRGTSLFPGITVTGGSGNRFSQNSIDGSVRLGIDLGDDGVTPNDPLDADTGPNGLQNFPVLTSARSGATTTITGTLSGPPGREVLLEFFASPTAHASGHGEGARFIGASPVTLDAAGQASFTYSGASAVSGGQAVSATATDSAGNTSEFSNDVLVPSTAFQGTALAVDAAGNGVLDPGETAVVSPTWTNASGAAAVLSGQATALTGPSGPDYALLDAAAAYGTIPDGGQASCASTGDCYGVRVSFPGARPQVHVDAALDETVSGGSAASWALHVGGSFTDVPAANPFYRFVETLLHRGVTAGCGGTLYCAAAPTVREQMAVFVLAAQEGAGYQPPACSAGGETFSDVPAASPFCRWIEELARRHVVSGCGGGLYCPAAPVTREQMAVFTLATREGSGYVPPACVSGSEVFGDVPASSPFCSWIEELARRHVVAGCAPGLYCPGAPVTREQMGVFLGVTFGLTLYGP